MTLREALAVALFGTLCFLVLPAYPSCDCAWFAYKALEHIGIKLKTIPAITVTPEKAGYRRGVVNVPPNSACMTYVHEFVHHDQWLHGFEAKKKYDAMWWGLEKNAEKLTKDAIENGASCPAED